MNVPPSNVPPSGDVGERLAALAGQRPWWPLAEPTPRWIRVRIGDELIADSRRALLHVQYGRGALPRSFLPTYYVPVDDVLPAALVDPVQAETGLTANTSFATKPEKVAAAALRAIDRGTAEIVVNPGPGRLLKALMDYFPGMGPVINRLSGADKLMAEVAEHREAARARKIAEEPARTA